MTLRELGTALAIALPSAGLIGGAYVVNERVDVNAGRLTKLEAVVATNSTSATASAAGLSLTVRLDGLDRRLDHLEAQLDRIEGLLKYRVR